MRIAAAQFAPTADPESNLARIEALAAEAAAADVSILVLPEEAMAHTGDVAGSLAPVAERSWARFRDGLAAVSARHRIALIASGLEPSGGRRPFNTMLAVDLDGRIAGSYRKLHLYDAFAYQESARVQPGDALPPVVELAGRAVGLLNCYDLRFPELSRALVDGGAEVLAVSAAWMRGRRKEDHWSTLLRARAIENTIWVVASGSACEECVAGSAIVDPMGVVVADAGEAPLAWCSAEVARERTAEVRRALPALANRRIAASYAVTRSLFVKAAVNGGRSRDETPHVPLAPEEIAAEAAAAVHDGAAVVHAHARTPDGAQTIDPEHIAALVRAVRERDPGIVVGTTTGLWTCEGHDDRMAKIAAWPREWLPDFASVAFCEDGAAEAAQAIVDRGMTLESAVWSMADVPALLASPTLHDNVRVLIEPLDEDPVRAVADCREMAEALRAGGVTAPLLYHGLEGSTWAVVRAAIEDGAEVRVGIEDVTVDERGELASNRMQIAEALRIHDELRAVRE
ncbi:3-keto-5-aminohexanoate cleavage protein [Leucobacter allii]|uniref:3-keto-5-aminohexanoate cleavage protein n=1 Tax=Leucobacter allii TaxID=2932247 RepID=A0ABY4FL40_9MICO|nr:nitrilase-related carbon-nitrogen hydrolase [Leucobacter allii]UOQ56992.1 3-keto-5-aminohexanoate cleavage protein [Leucobacter allii]